MTHSAYMLGWRTQDCLCLFDLCASAYFANRALRADPAYLPSRFAQDFFAAFKRDVLATLDLPGAELSVSVHPGSVVVETSVGYSAGTDEPPDAQSAISRLAPLLRASPCEVFSFEFQGLYACPVDSIVTWASEGQQANLAAIVVPVVTVAVGVCLVLLVVWKRKEIVNILPQAWGWSRRRIDPYPSDPCNPPTPGAFAPDIGPSSATSSSPMSQATKPSVCPADLQPGHTELLKLSAAEINAAKAKGVQLGHGGEGRVFRVMLSGHYPQPVAIKLLPQEESFRDELGKLAAVITHPCIIPILGVCYGLNCIVMELGAGSLHDALTQDKLQWRRRLQCLREAGLGLTIIHTTKKQPVLHLDIKPANMILKDLTKGGVMLADFGQMGTPLYRDDAAQDGTHSDIYSFGVTILEVVTGRRVPLFSLMTPHVTAAALLNLVIAALLEASPIHALKDRLLSAAGCRMTCRKRWTGWI